MPPARRQAIRRGPRGIRGEAQADVHRREGWGQGPHHLREVPSRALARVAVLPSDAARHRPRLPAEVQSRGCRVRSRRCRVTRLLAQAGPSQGWVPHPHGRAETTDRRETRTAIRPARARPRYRPGGREPAARLVAGMQLRMGRTGMRLRMDRAVGPRGLAPRRLIRARRRSRRVTLSLVESLPRTAGPTARWRDRAGRFLRDGMRARFVIAI
jgi:hypothetical protein